MKLDKHERKLLGDSSTDHLRVNDQALHNVLKGGQDNVGREERLGDGDSSVSTLGR